MLHKIGPKPRAEKLPDKPLRFHYFIRVFPELGEDCGASDRHAFDSLKQGSPAQALQAFSGRCGNGRWQRDYRALSQYRGDDRLRGARARWCGSRPVIRKPANTPTPGSWWKRPGAWPVFIRPGPTRWCARPLPVGVYPGFEAIREIRSEVHYADNSRADLLLQGDAGGSSWRSNP